MCFHQTLHLWQFNQQLLRLNKLMANLTRNTNCFSLPATSCELKVPTRVMSLASFKFSFATFRIPGGEHETSKKVFPWIKQSNMVLYCFTRRLNLWCLILWAVKGNSGWVKNWMKKKKWYEATLQGCSSGEKNWNDFTRDEEILQPNVSYRAMLMHGLFHIHVKYHTMQMHAQANILNV